MKLNLGVEDRRGVCPGGFLYGGTMVGAGDREGRPYERVTSSAVGGRTEASAPTAGYKGAYKNREYGLPQPVTSVTGFAMTGFLQEVRCKAGGGVRAKFFTVYINYSHIFA